MSKIWPHFSKENPCPACGGGGDWCCRAGDKKFICMRIESSHPSKDGGWFHEYLNRPERVIYHPVRRVAPPKIKMDFESIFNNEFSNAGLCSGSLADELGVSETSLDDLNFTYFEKEKSFACPMRDGDNKIIGIHLRCDDGSKKCVTGSQGGLFIPQIEPQKLTYIVEGASNTAAMLTMGFFAIGRFNCNSGADMLKDLIKNCGFTRLVIIADNDCLKYPPCQKCRGNGCVDCDFTGRDKSKGFYPGQDGAARLKKELGLMSVIFTCPNPVKDVRQLLQKLGIESARNYITNSVGQKIWTKV